MSNEEETPANFTVIQSTDDWNNFLERPTNLKLCLFTAPFCGVCKRMVKKVPKLAAEEIWTECEFATCDTAIVPELKETLRIGVGDAGEPLDRFMSSRFDLVEENLQKAARKSSRLALAKSQVE